MKIRNIILPIIIFSAGCINQPVGEDYFNDTDKIKGKNKPTAPSITDIVACDNEITIAFTESTDPDGDDLVYLVYYSLSDPAEFEDESEFYNPIRLVGVVEVVEDAVFYSNISGIIYFWMTAYDGGRESDHSAWDWVDIPGSNCS